MKVYFYILFSLLLVWPLQGQDVSVKRERKFTGAGLYGFMNGGADQFMEYDVMSLVTYDVTYKGEDYTIEIYEMPSASDAYGIYSIHVFRCERADNEGCIDCLSPYQLQAVSGNKYISVVFPSGSTAAKQGADELLRKHVRMDGDTPPIPSQIAKDAPFSGKVKYLRGPLSVHTASRALNNLLKAYKYDGVWFVADKQDDTYKAYILMNDEKDMAKLLLDIPADEVLEKGSGYVLISGKELEEEENDYGPFGF